MSEFDKKMSEIFDVTPVEKLEVKPIEKKELVPVSPETLNDDLGDAYQQSKENLQEFIDHGKDALEELIQIAKAGQHPRAFEVYSGLLKNLVDANKELLATQKQMREMDSKTKDKSGTQIDKAIFVGSTAELNKLIKGKE